MSNAVVNKAINTNKKCKKLNNRAEKAKKFDINRINN